eukprot:PLAT11067.2.p1 GENE.PLAT11067.2~~PLAT11067.2.p1  ORF type:complete len:148 (-),score=30.43 PLAT11067.2:2-445(-)
MGVTSGCAASTAAGRPGCTALLSKAKSPLCALAARLARAAAGSSAGRMSVLLAAVRSIWLSGQVKSGQLQAAARRRRVAAGGQCARGRQAGRARRAAARAAADGVEKRMNARGSAKLARKVVQNRKLAVGDSALVDGRTRRRQRRQA